MNEEEEEKKPSMQRQNVFPNFMNRVRYFRGRCTRPSSILLNSTISHRMSTTMHITPVLPEFADDRTANSVVLLTRKFRLVPTRFDYHSLPRARGDGDKLRKRTRARVQESPPGFSPEGGCALRAHSCACR